jgi:RNA recognition motif-containing protein
MSPCHHVTILEIEAANRTSEACPTQPPPGNMSGDFDALTNITTHTAGPPPPSLSSPPWIARPAASPPDQPAATAGRTCGIFVGNLSTHTNSEDIEKLFYQYGKATVLNRSGPGPHPRFTFVKLKDPRDAEDAVSTWNGYVLNGRRMKVEKEIRGHKRKKHRTKNSPPTGQLIEFEDDLATEHNPPVPLNMGTPTPQEFPGTFKEGNLVYGQLGRASLCNTRSSLSL